MRTVHAGCAALSAVIAPTVAIATPATAHATPPIGVSAVTLSKQTVNGKDHIVSDIRSPPTEAPAGTPTRVSSTASSSPVCSSTKTRTAGRTASTASEQRSPTPPGLITFTSPAI
jgi:hypothetical protein